MPRQRTPAECKTFTHYMYFIVRRANPHATAKFCLCIARLSSDLDSPDEFDAYYWD